MQRKPSDRRPGAEQPFLSGCHMPGVGTSGRGPGSRPSCSHSRRGLLHRRCGQGHRPRGGACGRGVRVPRTQQVPSSSLRGPQSGLGTCPGLCSVSGARTQPNHMPARGCGFRRPPPCPARSTPHSKPTLRLSGWAPLAVFPRGERICQTHYSGLRPKSLSPLFLGSVWGPLGRRHDCAAPERSWVHSLIHSFPTFTVTSVPDLKL